jgi:hypothetical protein
MKFIDQKVLGTPKSEGPEKLQAAATNAATACCSPQNRLQNAIFFKQRNNFFYFLPGMRK